MSTVTHMCIDRPVSAADKTKEYVQPQYFVDCLNALFLLPTRPYAPGIVSFQTNPFSLLRHICPRLFRVRNLAICPIDRGKLTLWLVLRRKKLLLLRTMKTLQAARMKLKNR